MKLSGSTETSNNNDRHLLFITKFNKILYPDILSLEELCTTAKSWSGDLKVNDTSIAVQMTDVLICPIFVMQSIF
jgi:hypothetical protein